MSELKSKLLFLGPSTVLAFLLSGCLMTRSQVEEYENKKNMQDQVVHLQKNTADQQVRFTEINNDLRDMNGRVDVVENKLRTSDAERLKTQQLLEEQLAETNKKVLALQEEIEKMNAVVASVTAAGAAATASSSSGSNHNAPIKGNTFDIAEDYFAKKDYQNAILWYEKYREKFPSGKKVPDALLRMGMSFQFLKMKEEAKGFYNELIQRFPQSAQAKSARARLVNINK